MIDTRDKRASCIAIGHLLGCPVLPFPNGSINEEDEQQLVWLYSGIQAGAPVIPAMVQYVGIVSTGSNYVGEVA